MSTRIKKHCLKCNEPLPNWTRVEGQPKNIRNRKYCLSCSPYGLHNTKKLHVLRPGATYHCATCGESDGSKFFRSQTSMCIDCNKKYVVERSRLNKRRAIEYLGSCCIICGYCEYDCSLDFHHL